MHSALRSSLLVNNAEALLKRALPNPKLTFTTQIVQTRRNIQTTPPTFWTAQHEQTAADRLVNRESLNPARAEGTSSGTDDEVASHDASFDPRNTAPESELEATGHESEAQQKTSNPLDVSAGNKEVNKTRDPAQDPPESGADRLASVKGWTRKGKQVNQDK